MFEDYSLLKCDQIGTIWTSLFEEGVALSTMSNLVEPSHQIPVAVDEF